MTTVGNNAGDAIRGAVLDELERAAHEDIGPRLEATITEKLEAYGSRHDYDVRALVQALEWDVKRSRQSIRITVRLPHPAVLFERGTVDHEIHAKGDGVLSFVWERRHDPPQWVRDQYEQEGDGWRVFLPSVEVSGLPEGRFIRDSLHEVGRALP